jgi:hypothetical protein
MIWAVFGPSMFGYCSGNGERIFWPQAVEQLERNVIHVKTFAIK